MKTYIRTLWPDDQKCLWESPAQRDALKNYLNDAGFYVLTGAGDSLEVYAVESYDPWDVQTAEKILDKMQKLWYTVVKK